MTTLTVISNHAEVVYAGDKAGLSVDLAYRNAGLTDGEGEFGSHFSADSAL
ncbi:hypothetical protein Q7I30_07695 [Aeromonas veronii]|uniref:hypothetical protein n=1 Tax=Aeromonas veronii TaxID=654 RepID=UPI0030061EFE